MPPPPVMNLRSLFDKALDLPPIERAHFLRDIQFKSPLVYKELRNLLIAHEGPSAFFEQDGGIWSQITPVDFTGRHFGPYRIVREIGRGGMGAVYEASRSDEAFHKTVAIKLISGAVLSEPALESFRRERQILAQLEHPNIARLLDGGATEDGLLYLTMEFVDGEPLDRFVETRQLSVAEILRIFLKVADAVSYAHRNLIVHRDLKPSNILVTAEGEVKLLDFGIAKVLNPDKDETATVAVRLTPEFASPEQIRGQAISTASDVYSLGVLLFYVLTGGARPYRTTSRAVPDILQAVLDSETPRPSSVAIATRARKLEGDIDNIILKAMAKEPERRYASVDTLRQDLERHLAGRPVLARADSWTYRASKFIRRNRLPVAFAALIVLTILIGAVTTLSQARIAQAQREAAETARNLAEDQRQRAEDASLAAEAQRLRADQRAAEAVAERSRAESQRASAEARYQSVRSLATAILFDVNESLRDVPGAANARKQAVLAALKHLEALAAKTSSDPALMEDIASAYEQTADIMDSLFEDSRDAASFAIPALLKAVRLREKLKDPVRLAETLRQLGNRQINAGQLPMAMQSYRSSLRLISEASPSPLSLRTTALAHSNLCTAFTIQEDATSALPECQAAVSILTSLDGRNMNDLPGLRLLTRFRLANALIRADKPLDAAKEFREAMEWIDPFETAQQPLLEEMIASMKTLPGSAGLQAAALRKLGVMQSRAGKRDESLESFEDSIRLSGIPQPTMKDVVGFAEICLLQAESRAAQGKGQVQRAIELAEEALNRIGRTPSGPASLLRAEIEASLRSFDPALARTLP